MRSPRVITLQNGLRIILAPQPEAPTATALVMVKAGSEHEAAQESGISHFLEHLAFKGSGAYPLPGQISHEIESLGAENNAWTTESHTAYWAKSQSGKIGRVLEIVSDLHLDPLLQAEEIGKERGVILEEIAMMADRPTSIVNDLMQALMHGDQPAGRPIVGTKESVKAITRAQIAAYRARRYRAPDTVVVVAGGFDVGAVSAFLRKRFAGLDARPAPRKARTREVQSGPAIRLLRKKTDQAHLQIAFRAAKLGDPLQQVLYTLATVLGGGSSSRLFTRVREEMGAAYYVSAWNEFSLDHGSLGVSVGASLRKAEEVVRVVLEECVRLTRELVPPREMRRARDYQIGTFLMGLESSDALASHYAHDVLLRGRVVPIRESIADMRAVTAEDVRRAARKFVHAEGLNLAGVGPDLDARAIRKLLELR